MSKVMNSPLLRVALAFGIYIALVVIASVGFYWMRQGIAEDSPVRYAYALYGPALALFTHMGYFLFGMQSLLLIPWLLLGALWAQARNLSVIGFLLCWLGIGWYMYDLF
jgi:hypothetical protein